jgi:hypothetical protein
MSDRAMAAFPMPTTRLGPILPPMKRSLSAAAIIAALAMAACGAAPDPSVTPTTNPTPSATPTQPQPSDTPQPSVAPTPRATGNYEPATVPQTENSTAATIIVPGGDGLVAIGFDGTFGSILWTSADGGRTWTDITPDDFASTGISSVAEYEGRLVAVGRGNTLDVDAQEAAVYVSDDGVSWRKVTEAGDMLGQLIDVVATDDGLFATGGVVTSDSGGIWHSTDGETWERVGTDFENAFLWSIAEGGPGLVTVGWRRNPEPDLSVWTSADAGLTWQLAPDPEGFAGFEATDVAALPDGSLAMVGSSFDGTGGRFWHSTDGHDWTLVSDTDGAWARTLTPTPLGLVAAGSGGEMLGAAWVSTDGLDWSPLGESIDGAYVTGAFATDDAVLLGGATQAGTLETGIEAHAAIWLAPLD